MKNDKQSEIILAHEFWSCKREYAHFQQAVISLFDPQSTKENRLEAFTAYGNFIRHLYTFYEGVIELRNKDLVAGLRREEKGPRISSILLEEVHKLIRSRIVSLNAQSDIHSGEVQQLIKIEVPANFGRDFRNIRNYFSHSVENRLQGKGLTLSGFYKMYHFFIMLLYRQCEFSWSVKNVEGYDWKEIDNFFTHVNENDKNIK